MQRFRGGLVFKAHRLCVSLNSRLESNKEEEGTGSTTAKWTCVRPSGCPGPLIVPAQRASTVTEGDGVWGLGSRVSLRPGTTQGDGATPVCNRLARGGVREWSTYPRPAIHFSRHKWPEIAEHSPAHRKPRTGAQEHALQGYLAHKKLPPPRTLQ